MSNNDIKENSKQMLIDFVNEIIDADYEYEYLNNEKLRNFYRLLKAYTKDFKFEDETIEIELVLAYEFLAVESYLFSHKDRLFRLMKYWKSARIEDFKNKLVVDVDNGFFNINGPMLIAGFPGVGKSTAAKMFTDVFGENICIDLESSDYHWIIDKDGNKHQHPEWPMNYVNAAKILLYETRGLKDYENLKFICISTHKDTLQILNDQEVEFCIVTPFFKDEALKRYKERGSSPDFIKSMDDNWDKYMDDINSYGMPVVMTDEYLCDILKDNRLVRFIGNQKLADAKRKALLELDVAIQNLSNESNR